MGRVREGEGNVTGEDRERGCQQWCPRSDSGGRCSLTGAGPQRLRRKILPKGGACSFLLTAAGRSWKMKADERKSASKATHMLDKGKLWSCAVNRREK